MKKIHTAVTLIIIFFMVAALYICGRYENAPDRIFTGKVSAPEGEWTIDASDGVTKAEVTFSLADFAVSHSAHQYYWADIILVLFHIAVPSSGIYQRDHAGQTQDAVRDA